MKRVCPNCEAIKPIENINREEVHSIRREEFTVTATFQRCLDCGTEFENTRGPDALQEAYRIYRQRHDMMQPEDIRALRVQYGLTQRELAGLLNWGGATLSRYENGALQEGAHDKLLKLACDPHNLIQLIRDSEGVLNHDKKIRLLNELESVDAEAFSIERVIERRLGAYEPSEYSGYRKLDWQKLRNTVLFLCIDGQLKTKLTKLLFYVDFKHFKENAVPITGARYAHLPHGPVPNDYEYLLAPMIHEDGLLVSEVLIHDFVGENYETKSKPDMSIFSPHEIQTLEHVKNYFEGYSATRIRDFSHQERAYKETAEQELISYRYANDLQI